jgi:2-phosphoglycerate kinase
MGSGCAAKIARKIRKKVKKAGARIVRADDAVKVTAIVRQLDKADALVRRQTNLDYGVA